jgi:hypothetical protein
MTGVNFLMVMQSPAPQPNIRDRLAARLLARRLDWALANGADSEQSAALSLRARRLTSLPRRRVVADSLRRLLNNGRVEPQGRAQVSQLAHALAEPGPVDPRGAARAWLLVTDGTGPLYGRGNLRGYAASATRYLRPTPLPE